MKKIVSCVFIMFLSMVQCVPYYSLFIREIEEKYYYRNFGDTNFTNDEVIVVLNEKESLNFRRYTKNDFKEINCKKVIDITENYRNLLKVNSSINSKFRRILMLKMNSNNKENVLYSIEKLIKRSDVVSAEPNFIIKNELMSAPNDYYYNNSYYDGNNSIYQWAIDDTELIEAWNVTDCFEKNFVNVGIIDSGIEYTNNHEHEDLFGNVNTALSNDFTNNSFNHWNIDSEDHGTRVAGIIAAERGNGLGIAGVSDYAKVVSLKINTRESNQEKVVTEFCNAFSYATSYNIPILNCSFGYDFYSNSMKTAIDNYPGLVICAAGNSKSNVDVNNVYPACYNCDNIISVGAIDMNGNIWNSSSLEYVGSNFGVNNVDIFAPGDNIISTSSDGSYDCDSGTSYAAPYVAGAAALLLSMADHYEQGTITTSMLKNILLSTGTPISTLTGKCSTGTKLNIFNAIKTIHEHDLYYDFYNDLYHYYYCNDCSYAGYEEHIWEIQGLNSYEIYDAKIIKPLPQICKLCNTTKI